MEQSNNLKLPLIDVNNAEDLKITFINFVKMICGVDDSSALQILDRAIQNLQTTKQDKLTPGENITITNNVISGVGGVEEEDVMNIIENNAEQTETLEVENATEIAIGTSATFDATSDEQIPTSKAVSDLMAGAGGGSKLYKHFLDIRCGTKASYAVIICNISENFTLDSLKNYIAEKGNYAVVGSYLDGNMFLTATYVRKAGANVNVCYDYAQFSIVDNNISITKGSIGYTVDTLYDTAVEL